ncbi:acid phosphatase 1-like [Nymphaea colorata]|nr:acid phosphatase 1-like [Nymphaea colorata]
MAAPSFFLLAVVTCVGLAGAARIQRVVPESSSRVDGRGRSRNNRNCSSWHFVVETNGAGHWATVPQRCVGYVKQYMTGKSYESDSAAVASEALEFARSVNMTGDGKDAWVFDIDDTLVSCLPYYAEHGYGSEVFNETTFDEWVDEGVAPALPETKKLYYELHSLGFQIFLITGRSESQRNLTASTLRRAGYSSWKKLVLRGTEDKGKLAIIYKSKKRLEIEKEGYRIHGSAGDQWSDLLGNATATRSFKLPNPMYFIA